MKEWSRTSAVLQKIRFCVETGIYILKKHQKMREKERNITRSEVLYVLKRGQLNFDHSGFNSRFQKDTYAIFGRTVDGKELEVIVSFNEQESLEIIRWYYEQKVLQGGLGVY